MMSNELAHHAATLVKNALEEDLGRAGDITSLAIFSQQDRGRARIRAKENGIISGLDLLEPLFHEIDPALEVAVGAVDGNTVAAGRELCRLSGSIRSILAGERIALNLLQRLSGIATRTHGLAARISHTAAQVLDTRKTTPGLRVFEKQAVLAGGGVNHRWGLYDMILIKDTHVKAAGGVTEALRRAQAYVKNRHPGIRIEIEVQNERECREATGSKPDIIMLDNMDIPELHSCVELIRAASGNILAEASGNINEETICAVAETGVDYISCGALTHSVKALDIHLVMLEEADG
ncbi:MAG: carboxylating nicotinate-nucleotide diphosphorylase [Chitinivibrionales bacterium]|nr:carboxylating nicotinate-nucleotide diphosphorylase [Chitinivibrionales bacterium]